MQVHETQSDIRSGGGVHGERERKSERRTLEGTSTIAKRGRRTGGEQSRTEQRWAIDRKSEDGYTRLWRERARTPTF